MNKNPIRHTLVAALLLLAAQPTLRAAETNLPPARPISTNHFTATNKPTNAERRAAIEAWRTERAGTNHTKRTVHATPAEDTRKMPIPERRVRLRAKLADLRAKKMSGILTPQEQTQLNYLEAHQMPALATTNAPATHPAVPK